MIPLDKIHKYISLLPSPLSNITVKTLNWYIHNQCNNTKGPLRVIFFVTNKCNFHCGHCFYSKELNANTDELTIDEIWSLLNNAKGTIRHLNITGGEPFMRQDLADIVKACYRAKIFSISVNTNGFFTERIRDFITKLLHNKHLRISISLSYHSDIMRIYKEYENSFRETYDLLSGLESLYDNLSLKIIYTVSSENLRNLESLYKLFPANKININLFRDYARCGWGIPENAKNNFNHPNPSYEALTNKDIERIIYMLKSQIKQNVQSFNSIMLIKKLEYISKIENQKRRLFRCSAGYTDCVIYQNGDMALCELTRPIGNIRMHDYDLQRLWNMQATQEMRKSLSSCACTLSCNIKSSLLLNRNTFEEIFIPSFQK